MFKNIFSNPFSKKAKLSDLAKQEAVLGEILGFAGLASAIIFLFFLAFIAILFFNIPFSVVAILVGTEILITIIASLVKFNKIKSLLNISTKKNAEAYRSIVITSEYYEFIKAIVGFLASIISVILVLVLLPDQVASIAQSIPLQSSLLSFTIFIFVVYRLYNFILRLLRYVLVKKLNKHSNLAEVNRDFEVVNKKIGILQPLPFFIIMSVILYVYDIPFFIIGILGGFMIFMILLSIIELIRIKNIRFDSTTIHPQIKLKEDEKISEVILGIMKVAADAKNMFKPVSMSILGSGKNFYPENTLLITNHRLIMIQIPIDGGDKIVDDTDYVQDNFFFNRGELQEKAETLMKIKNITELSKLATNDVLYSDVKSIILKQRTIVIKKNSGEKIAYFFLDKEHLEPIKKWLALYLKDKFIV